MHVTLGAYLKADDRAPWAGDSMTRVQHVMAVDPAVVVVGRGVVVDAREALGQGPDTGGTDGHHA